MKRLLVLYAAIGMLTAASVCADVVHPPDHAWAYYSNTVFPQVLADDVTPDEDGLVTTIAWYGVYFDDVQPAPGAETFTMRFFDDAGGLPGTLLWEESASVSGVATGSPAWGRDEYKFTYTPAAPFSVSSGVTTWLSIFSDEDDYLWETSNTGGGNDIAGTTTDPFLTDWRLGGMTVDVALELVIVPEPGTFFLLGLGAVGLALYRRRKR